MRLPIVSVALAILAMTTGCTGTLVDGYDAAYVEGPPPDVEYYPRYAFHDGYVYDVNGRYYHEHHGRWAVYRRAPAEIRHARPSVRDERGRAEHQR